MDGRPGNEYFLIPHKISALLTPLTPLGVCPQCLLITSLKEKFETDRSNSSQSGMDCYTRVHSTALCNDFGLDWLSKRYLGHRRPFFAALGAEPGKVYSLSVLSKFPPLIGRFISSGTFFSLLTILACSKSHVELRAHASKRNRLWLKGQATLCTKEDYLHGVCSEAKICMKSKYNFLK